MTDARTPVKVGFTQYCETHVFHVPLFHTVPDLGDVVKITDRNIRNLVVFYLVGWVAQW